MKTMLKLFGFTMISLLLLGAPLTHVKGKKKTNNNEGEINGWRKRKRTGFLLFFISSPLGATSVLSTAFINPDNYYH